MIEQQIPMLIYIIIKENPAAFTNFSYIFTISLEHLARLGVVFNPLAETGSTILMRTVL